MNECNVYHSVRHLPIPERQIVHVVLSVVRGLKKRGVVSVHCIGDRRMTELNHLHRGKEGPTDVLSFAAQEGKWRGQGDDWGDIFICVPQIKRQAKVWHVPIREEFTRMLVHGLLHLLGYDHEKKHEAEKMFRLQEKYVQKWV